jgi:SynChlorMet cassette protein ScmD
LPAVETFNCRIEVNYLPMLISDKPIANPTIVLREEFDNWAFLFNPENAEIVIINPTGVVAWKSMNGKNTSEDIVAQVRECFSDVPDDAIEHVHAFIRDLEERGLIGLEVVN